MRLQKIKRTLFLWFTPAFLFFTGSVFAQDSLALKQLINASDKNYGPSDLLNLGEIYRPERSNAGGNPFFLNEDRLTLIDVKGYVFKNVRARYNLESDQLILLAGLDSGATVRITAKENWVTSFSFNNYHFVNMAQFLPALHLSGYFELVYSGKMSLFIKRKKTFINTYNDVTPYGFYSEIKTSFYISDKVNFIAVKNKKAFLKLYPNNKKEIKKYLKDNKIKFTKSSNEQLTKLMRFCDELSETN